MNSPINNNPEYYYYDGLMIENSDYHIDKVTNEYIEDITDNDYIYITKVWYCINQVLSFVYCPSDWALNTAEQKNLGEADGNDKLTANDAAFIAKAIAEDRVAELPETADFNGDGNISAFDCAKIAQFITAKALAKATGMVG